jgi:hypothetical protein
MRDKSLEIEVVASYIMILTCYICGKEITEYQVVMFQAKRVLMMKKRGTVVVDGHSSDFGEVAEYRHISCLEN